ncbi:L-dopachrome isomerase [Entamoeba marina]
MPFALITIAAEITQEVQKEIAIDAMKILSDVTGKPISYCSAQVVLSVGGFNGGNILGDYKENKKDCSNHFCNMLNKRAGIESNRIYLNFTEMERNNWGYDGTTF